MATILQTARERDPETDPTWEERIPFPRGGHIPSKVARNLAIELPDGRTLPRHKAKRLGTIEDHLIGKHGRKVYGQLRDGMAKATRRKRGSSKANR